MEFISVADSRPSVVRFFLDGRRIQRSQVAGVIGQRPAQRHGAGPPFFQGGVVKEGVGHGV